MGWREHLNIPPTALPGQISGGRHQAGRGPAPAARAAGRSGPRARPPTTLHDPSRPVQRRHQRQIARQAATRRNAALLSPVSVDGPNSGRRNPIAPRGGAPPCHQASLQSPGRAGGGGACWSSRLVNVVTGARPSTWLRPAHRRDALGVSGRTATGSRRAAGIDRGGRGLLVYRAGRWNCGSWRRAEASEPRAAAAAGRHLGALAPQSGPGQWTGVHLLWCSHSTLSRIGR